MFRRADDKKRGGEEGKNSLGNGDEENDRKEIKCTTKSSSDVTWLCRAAAAGLGNSIDPCNEVCSRESLFTVCER